MKNLLLICLLFLSANIYAQEQAARNDFSTVDGIINTVYEVISGPAWANILAHCENDRIMLKAFEDFNDQLIFCDWNIPSDIINSFRTADIIKCKGESSNRVIFNVGGNKYRLICTYKFGIRSIVLYVKFIGTHAEYDRIEDVCEVNMFK